MARGNPDALVGRPEQLIVDQANVAEPHSGEDHGRAVDGRQGLERVCVDDSDVLGLGARFGCDQLVRDRAQTSRVTLAGVVCGDRCSQCGGYDGGGLSVVGRQP
jgi:hypothetical protein